GVAAAADVDERGLHRRKHVLHAAQVDVADERRLLRASDVVLHQHAVLEDADLRAALLRAHDHLTVDGLAAREELGFGHDAAATARVAAVAATLLLRLQTRGALDALRLGDDLYHPLAGLVALLVARRAATATARRAVAPLVILLHLVIDRQRREQADVRRVELQRGRHARDEVLLEEPQAHSRRNLGRLVLIRLFDRLGWTRVLSLFGLIRGRRDLIDNRALVRRFRLLTRLFGHIRRTPCTGRARHVHVALRAARQRLIILRSHRARRRPRGAAIAPKSSPAIIALPRLIT